KGYSCNSCRRASCCPEKVHERTFCWQRVLVRQNPDGPTFFQNLEHRSSRLVLEDRLVPRSAPVSVHQRIYKRIVDRPRHVVQRISIESMRIGREFPRSDMGGQNQYSLSPLLRLEEILVPVQQDELLDVGLGVAPQPRKLHGLPSQIPHHPPLNLLPLFPGPLAKRY